MKKITAVIVMLASAAHADSIAALGEDYLAARWRASPMGATQVGYHQGGVARLLDDVSPEARQRRVRELDAFAARARKLSARALRAEDEADRQLLLGAIALERQALVETRDFERRVDEPLGALGSVFFAMLARPDGDLDARAADVAARLRQVPAYLRRARANVGAHVDIFRLAALDDGAGLREYLAELPASFTASARAAEVRFAAGVASAAVDDYLAFVRDELPRRPRADFRYGAKAYARRFAPYLQTTLSPDEVLRRAEARVRELHADMGRLAEQLLTRAGQAPPPAPLARIRAALALVAEHHPRADGMLAAARAQVEEARRFIDDKGLLTLPTQGNLEVIETPAFLRSVLGVAAFDGAPPLQPKAGAFYYVTPFPTSWDAAKVESKLREYNDALFFLITVHEAMPGHYVQFERANQVTPASRRVLRWLLGADAFVEGWAVYTQDVLVDAGVRAHDPGLLLMQRKLELRAVINTVLDIRLHTRALADAEALRLMIEDGFQEKPEAEQKLRRAKLSVTQLCSYFVGGEAWRALRKTAEQRPGFDARRFHDEALRHGAVPLPSLPKLLSF